MTIGHAIKQENFRPLNKESDGVKKSRIRCGFFCSINNDGNLFDKHHFLSFCKPANFSFHEVHTAGHI